MADLITAPGFLTYRSNAKALFMAGGISGCPPWQEALWEMLKDLPDLVVLNPRRETYDDKEWNFASDPRRALAESQISWEWQALRKCCEPGNAVSFWFCQDSLQPIVMLEFGRCTASINPVVELRHDNAVTVCTRPPKVFVGIDKDYERRMDVEIQLALQCPGVPVVHELGLLAADIRTWAKKGK